jgi:broad specificity phosphatase PhoE
MAQLLLVRHGQASFGARNYDALSELGHEQSRVLGAALASRGAVPDLVVRGELRRHEETAAGVVEGLGVAVPVEVDADWDEFDFQHVVEVHKPLYRNRAMMKADLARSLRPRHAFQEVFEAATKRWTSGEFDSEYLEPFPAFRGRIDAALRRAVERLESGGTVLVVSSGGPIGMAVASLLVREPAMTAASVVPLWAALNRTAVNTGVTKVLAGRRGLSLSTYNEHAHLEPDHRLVTYR